MSEEKKREWWPIGIATAMIVFMGGVLFAVSIMVRNDVPLTSDDYYAKEIAYQDEIDKSARAMAVDQLPVVRVLDAADVVEINFPGRKGAGSFSGTATFFRPSDPTQDFKTELHPDSTGLQWIGWQGRPKGLWLLELAWTQDNTPYYHELKITH